MSQPSIAAPRVPSAAQTFLPLEGYGDLEKAAAAARAAAQPGTRLHAVLFAALERQQVGCGLTSRARARARAGGGGGCSCSPERC